MSAHVTTKYSLFHSLHPCPNCPPATSLFPSLPFISSINTTHSTPSFNLHQKYSHNFRTSSSPFSPFHSAIKGAHMNMHIQLFPDPLHSCTISMPSHILETLGVQSAPQGCTLQGCGQYRFGTYVHRV